MKKHATTIVLVLMAAALGVWLFLQRDSVTEGERKRRENSVFSAWRRDELSRLEIVHEGETLVLARDAKKDSAWRMMAPREERCDQAAVERLITTLEFAGVSRKASEGGALGLGLDAPRAAGVVTMGGLVLRFALGGPSPRPEGSSYFRVEGEAPVVVKKELALALLQPADTYRDRTVVPYLSIDLARFDLKHREGGVTLDRLDDRSFRVEQTGVMGSREGVDGLWAALAEMRAEVFPSDADAERLTRSPELTITMTPKDASKPVAELVVGGPCPGHDADVVVLRRAPSRVAACAPRGALDALRVTPASLTERRPFTLRPDEMEEVRLESLVDQDAGAPRVIELARKGTGFHEREPVDRDLPEGEADAAAALLGRIAASIATSVARAGGSEPFTAVARARVRSGEHEEVVEVGPLVGDSRVVLRRTKDGARLEVTPAVARRLTPRATSLAPRVLLGETRRATRVVLRCGVPQELVDRGSGFRFVEPAGFEADASILSLVEALTRGSIDAWVADGPDGAFGIDKDACRVVLGFEDDKAPATILIGAEGEGGVYGAVEGRQGVFVAPKSLRHLVEDIYVSRSTLRVELSKVERVRVLRDGKAVPGLDADALRGAVAGLYAERVVRAGRGAGVKDVARPDLVVEISVAGAGAPKRVVCGPPEDDRRVCGAEGVDATFRVLASKFAGFLGAPDGGDVARDGGPR